MLLCKEQKSTINMNGRDIHISDKVANAHYMMHAMPVSAGEVHTYFNAYNNGDVESILAGSTADALLTTLIMEEAKDILGNKFENFWNSVPQ